MFIRAKQNTSPVDAANLSRRPGVTRRRGIALAEVLVGGIMLAIALGVVLTVSARSLSTQAAGQSRLVASWLADELLTMVLVEGPAQYGMMYDTTGRFDPPFEDFQYDLDIRFQGQVVPYKVQAVVSWGPRSNERVEVETLIAVRQGDPEQPRQPFERVDRDARYYDEDEYE